MRGAGGCDAGGGVAAAAAAAGATGTPTQPGAATPAQPCPTTHAESRAATPAQSGTPTAAAAAAAAAVIAGHRVHDDGHDAAEDGEADLQFAAAGRQQPAEQRLSPDRLPRSARRRLRRQRPPADLPAAVVRTFPQAPRRRLAHRLHEAEAARHQPGRV